MLAAVYFGNQASISWIIVAAGTIEDRNPGVPLVMPAYPNVPRTVTLNHPMPGSSGKIPQRGLRMTQKSGYWPRLSRWYTPVLMPNASRRPTLHGIPPPAKPTARSPRSRTPLSRTACTTSVRPATMHLGFDAPRPKTRSPSIRDCGYMSSRSAGATQGTSWSGSMCVSMGA